MKVHELIAELAKYPQELEVMVECQTTDEEWLFGEPKTEIHDDLVYVVAEFQHAKKVAFARPEFKTICVCD